MHTPRAPQAYTVREAAEILAVNTATVHRAIHAGRLPSFRFGQAVRIPRTAVEALLNGQPAETHRAPHAPTP